MEHTYGLSAAHADLQRAKEQALAERGHAQQVKNDAMRDAIDKLPPERHGSRDAQSAIGGIYGGAQAPRRWDVRHARVLAELDAQRSELLKLRAEREREAIAEMSTYTIGPRDAQTLVAYASVIRSILAPFDGTLAGK